MCRAENRFLAAGNRTLTITMLYNNVNITIITSYGSIGPTMDIAMQHWVAVKPTELPSVSQSRCEETWYTTVYKAHCNIRNGSWLFSATCYSKL
jgi:hypothetical protein